MNLDLSASKGLELRAKSLNIYTLIISRKHLAVVSILLFLVSISGMSTFAYARTSAAPDVVELYTSHGCSSCPSADKLLGELIAENPQLVALEFHVDYWDQLVHGGDGNWVDPFSDAAFTDRQREYNAMRLDGRRGVYTPQMVINGEYAAVGSDRARVVAQLGKRQAPIAINAKRDEASKLLIDIENPDQLRSQLWLVTFDIAATTDITAGENRHRTIENHHIVKSLQPLLKIEAKQSSTSIPLALKEGEGCALLVQSQPLQPILGASLCP